MKGGYIVWTNYGCEGWSPKECKDLDGVKEAIHETYGSEYKVTYPVEIELREVKQPQDWNRCYGF
jgi:hypothetical protein